MDESRSPQQRNESRSNIQNEIALKVYESEMREKIAVNLHDNFSQLSVSQLLSFFFLL